CRRPRSGSSASSAAPDARRRRGSAARANRAPDTARAPAPRSARSARSRATPARAPTARAGGGPDSRFPASSSSPVAEPRRGPRTGRPLLPQEAVQAEGRALAQQVVDRPPQPGRQDAQRLLRAVLLRQPLLPGLDRRAAPDQQTHRLRKGPFEVGVADLLAA